MCLGSADLSALLPHDSPIPHDISFLVSAHQDTKEVALGAHRSLLLLLLQLMLVLMIEIDVIKQQELLLKPVKSTKYIKIIITVKTMITNLMSIFCFII